MCFLLFFACYNAFFLPSVALGATAAVPGGLLVDLDCVIRVEQGSRIIRGLVSDMVVSLSGAVSHHPHCKELVKSRTQGKAGQTFPGYLYSAFAQEEDQMQSWSSTWSVPFPASKPGPGYSFWWIGAIDNFWGGSSYQVNVLQPVLQYSGSGDAFGMRNFSYACWFAGNNYYYTDQVEVMSGDQVFGSVVRDSDNPNSWSCRMKSTQGNAVTLHVYGDGTSKENAAIVGVEAYGGSGSCAELPAPHDAGGCFFFRDLQLILQSGAVVKPISWSERPTFYCNMTSALTSSSITLCYSL